jgi:hypothetical protein
MTRHRFSYRIVATGALAALLVGASPALAQTEDHAPVGLKSSSKMEQDKTGSESWTYAQSRDVFTKYRTLIVDPTAVYNGPDAQFDGGISAADRSKFAGIVTEQLRSELAKSFPQPASPQADTLRMKVTLLGAQQTKGGIATATRVTPMGFGLSAVKSVVRSLVRCCSRSSSTMRARTSFCSRRFGAGTPIRSTYQPRSGRKRPSRRLRANSPTARASGSRT